MLASAGPLPGVAAARRELGRLRGELDALELTRRQRHEAATALAVADEELRRNAPEPRRVAAQLARFTTVLRSAGALPGAPSTLAHALDGLRAWLGPLPF
jgi:hypothetical protein